MSILMLMNIQPTLRAPIGSNDLSMVSINDLDSRTLKAKSDDAVVGYYAHTQAWTFKGGDALVVMGPGSSLVFFIRIGNNVGRVTGYQGIQGVFENPPMWLANALGN